LTPLEDIVAGLIRSEGPIDFARYMQLALYHPEHGYYAKGVRRTGWAGDFLTSPEVDRAYGELWGRGFEHVWDACGRPQVFHVIEVGPGEGSLAAAVLDSAAGSFARALRYLLVERLPDVARRQRKLLDGDDRVVWATSLSELTPVSAGCIFANEVVDNIPVRLVSRRGPHLVELCVGIEDGELEFIERTAPPELVGALDSWNVDVSDGHRMEVPLESQDWAAAAGAVMERGAVVIVDYGDYAAALATRPAGTLLCYSSGGVDDRPLASPGDKDITVHANWDALRAGLERAGAREAGPVPQRDVLKALGADELTNRLRSEADSALARGAGAEAFRALSRRGALGVLTDRSGLGGLGVLAGIKNVSLPAFLASKQ
jgi:SAM-dependent MidA family methyltransferase